MQARPDTIVCRALRGTGVLAVAVAVVVLMTWPLAKGMGRLGRTGSGDGLFSIWNVAWVARTIVADPVNLFRANIFFPHEHALAYSEANIGAGVLAIPAWWLTQNPYTALNTALLLAFATNLIGMWLLARYLCRDKAAAATSGLCVLPFFLPYIDIREQHNFRRSIEEAMTYSGNLMSYLTSSSHHA